jgi:hypothetical protein
MVINLSNNGKVGNTTLSSYDKVMIIDHKPESKLLVLKLHSGDRIDFSYEELEETPNYCWGGVPNIHIWI